MKLGMKDVIAQLRGITERLQRGDIDWKQAQIEQRGLMGEIKATQNMLVHAIQTRRLQDGSPNLPDFEYDAETQPTVAAAVERPRIASGGKK